MTMSNYNLCINFIKFATQPIF